MLLRLTILIAVDKSMRTCKSAILDTLPVCAGSIALSPILGIANLACGVLNLDLAGYNTYQLRGISKKLDAMQEGQQQAHVKHWIMR